MASERISMADAARIASSLSESQRRAVTRSFSRTVRAGHLFPGLGKIEAQGWLRETDLFERYFHSGYLAYRLTPLGEQVRAILKGEGE